MTWRSLHKKVDTPRETEDLVSAYRALLNDQSFVSDLKKQFPEANINITFLRKYFKGYQGHHGPFLPSDRTQIKFQFVKAELHRPFLHIGTVHK